MAWYFFPSNAGRKENRRSSVGFMLIDMYNDDKRKMWIKEITIKITMKNVKVSTCTIAACVGVKEQIKKLTDSKISTFAVQARCTRKRELTFSFRHLYEIKFTRME